MNRHSDFTRYRSSRDRSSAVEDQDVSPRAGLLYDSGYSGSSNLLILNLNNSDGNPLLWPEWSIKFIATVDHCPLPDSENMSPLKTLLDRQRKVSNLRKGLFWIVQWNYIEDSGEEVWNVIIDAQLESLRKESQVKPQRSDQFLSYCFKLCECAERVQADW